jgi:CheY-like chemotaxis protein
MSRILLADDSPHAQRMGEFILREDGFEVVSVTDGETALVRLADVAPDLILADVSLPRKNGYEICQAVKGDPGCRHTKVVLTAGALEPIDEEEARRVQADGSLRKPFEATMMLDIVRPLAESARKQREHAPEPPAPVESVPELPAEVEGSASPAEISPEAEAGPVERNQAASRREPDPQSVRAAVTLAIEAALPVLIDEVTERVMRILSEPDCGPEEVRTLGSAGGT